MKLLWLLFAILLELAWKLAMIAVAFYLVVAVAMGVYWVAFESGEGLILAGAAIVVIIMVAGAAAGRSE